MLKRKKDIQKGDYIYFKKQVSAVDDKYFCFAPLSGPYLVTEIDILNNEIEITWLPKKSVIVKNTNNVRCANKYVNINGSKKAEKKGEFWSICNVSNSFMIIALYIVILVNTIIFPNEPFEFFRTLFLMHFMFLILKKISSKLEEFYSEVACFWESTLRQQQYKKLQDEKGVINDTITNELH